SVKRRMRRSIASRRNRIKRLRALLLHIGILDNKALDETHPTPWLLAAKALQDPKYKLSWQEIWFIIRWYAHNRGYDGNRLWANVGDEDQEDTKRVEAAKALMLQHKSNTMAETMCSYLEVDTENTSKLELRN